MGKTTRNIQFVDFMAAMQAGTLFEGEIKLAGAVAYAGRSSCMLWYCGSQSSSSLIRSPILSCAPALFQLYTELTVRARES